MIKLSALSWLKKVLHYGNVHLLPIYVRQKTHGGIIIAGRVFSVEGLKARNVTIVQAQYCFKMLTIELYNCKPQQQSAHFNDIVYIWKFGCILQSVTADGGVSFTTPFNAMFFDVL